MIDANEVVLNQEMKRIENIDRREDGVAAYADSLLAEGGDFYPFAHDNIVEALSNANNAAMMALTSQVESAEKNPLNVVAQECVAFQLRKLIRDYWKDAAEKYADAHYKEPEPEGREWEAD